MTDKQSSPDRDRAQSEDQDESMYCQLTKTEQSALRDRLDALPETMPPRSVWSRIEAQGHAEGLLKRRFDRLRWVAGSGIAAAVVLAVLNLPNDPERNPALADGDGSLPTVPEYADVSEDPMIRSINALMVQSQFLERDLNRLPAPPRVMRASTVATIEDLESRIAAIDYRLNHPRIRMSRRQQEAYWRERVRLMDSLLRLRYAQAQRHSF